MSWEHLFTTDLKSGIHIVLSHTYLIGRGDIRNIGFSPTDEFIEAVKSRDPKILDILEMVIQDYELIFAVKDLEGGTFFDPLYGNFDEVGPEDEPEFRSKLEQMLTSNSPFISERDKEVAQRGIRALDLRVLHRQQAEAYRLEREALLPHNVKRRREFNRNRDRLMIALIERDGYYCALCGATEDLSIDHIHPLSKGGTDDLENLRILCRSHNSQKSNRIPEAEPKI